MDVFLSHSHADRKWAEKLRTALLANGLSVWSAESDLKPGERPFPAIMKAVLAAPSLVVLVEPKGTIPPEEARATLEAVWSDPEKRLIPILVGDVRVPPYLRSAGPVTSMTRVIQVPNPRTGWNRATSDLIEILKGEAGLAEKMVVIDTRQEDRRLRRKRLAYIGRLAASFERAEDRRAERAGLVEPL
ncbi:MAG TPA: toll/interleukin-1 receptor domain-containing protein [Thermoanaerobaculia bacterium]|nr:toll/interleukin-1 receptor domain-containing protein [Thermoanaerobaculia bacterium]